MNRTFTDHTFTLADGRTLSYRHWPGRGTPLVLLHGLLDSRAGWDDFAAITHRPVFAFDLPGFGRSDLPVRPRISAYALDITAGVRQLRLGRYVLVGHSLGGGVATHLAELDRRRCAALCLLAPVGFGRQMIAEMACVPGMRHAISVSLPVWLSVGPLTDMVYRTMVANGHSMDGRLRQRLRAHARADAGARGVIMAAEAIAHAGRSGQRSSRTVRFDGPVSAVWGDRDLLISAEHQHAVRRAIPHARVHVWAGMGHHPQVERRRQLAALIERTASKARAHARRRHRRPARRPFHTVRPAPLPAARTRCAGTAAVG